MRDRSRRTTFPRAALLAAALLPIVAGCDNPAPRTEGGPEMRFITSKAPVLTAEATGAKSLLPLTPGTTWSMLGVIPSSLRAGTRPVLYPIEARVTTGPTITLSGDSSGSMVEIRKEGRLWRREVYKGTQKELALMAAADDANPLIVYSPAIPLARYPVEEGQSLPWQGTLNYQGQTYPATAFSRVSAIESVVTHQGKQTAFRIDTLISVNSDGAQTSFRTVRWLTPGIGFVRRAFTDKGHGIYTELQKVTLPSPLTTVPSGQ